ncbi:hypothetical protein SLEP1_g48962 [Rubroshorea leprosula]|uniref:Uncharacterized protein n=1 Tax=Rubroshorea leprosula TaxID=152421 RepID=A0AAV5LVC8_9ROSI|nr:hypothetical protein SLEP1_g48962 [Rubroshorea leprosula]
MSRCFPYPPPGYVKNGIRDEALIESIKLKREEEKARKGRKKEKKCEKKAKERAREGGEIEGKKHRHRKRHRDERSQDPKGGDHQKRSETEVENNEKSSLTEEDGQAVGSQNSSDSTLNSNKRQKQSPPSDSSHNPGISVRIKIASQRHKDPELTPSSKEHPSSAFGRIKNAYAQGMVDTASVPGIELGENPCSIPQNAGPRITLKLSKDIPHQSSCAPERFADKAEATLMSKLCSSCPPTLALQFKNLVEDWIPPPLESAGSEEKEWLFQRMLNHQPMAKRMELGNVCLSQGNPSLWPCACHLPEVDTYALPFTIPF